MKTPALIAASKAAAAAAAPFAVSAATTAADSAPGPSTALAASSRLAQLAFVPSPLFCSIRGILFHDYEHVICLKSCLVMTFKYC